jgi:pimeloyl-ACP methyl ester carboxylesterase
MGSAIALSLALDSPERVLGLVLLGAAARLRVPDDPREGCPP